MLSKRYESTEVDRRTWLHVPLAASKVVELAYYFLAPYFWRAL